jgi:hypothetical protein
MTLSSYAFSGALLLCLASYVAAAVFYVRARPHYLGPRGLAALLRHPFASALVRNYGEGGTRLMLRARMFYFTSAVSFILSMLVAYFGFGRW